jgi:hypothetical protein
MAGGYTPGKDCMGNKINPIFKDLGLDYSEAAHGLQSAIAYDPENKDLEPKHQRVAIDMQKADTMGLATLLIEKGVFTLEEYIEYMRLAANTELANREEELSDKFGVDVSCR